MGRTIKKNGYLILFLYYIISFFLDRLIFDFDRLNVFNYVCIKIILLFVVFWLYYYLPRFNFLKTKFFLVYCVLFAVIFFVLYPGTWLGSDVFLIYEKAVTCDFYYHLNYLTTLFYIVSFMIIPLPVAPIILQILFSASVFAYISQKTMLTFKFEKKFAWLMITPFILFHSIFYILYPNRPILFGLIVLAIFVTLFCDFYKKPIITKLKMFLLVSMTAVVSIIRTEAIYLIIVVPMLIFFIYGLKSKYKKWGILKYIALFLIPFLIVGAPQKDYELFGQTLHERQSRNLPSYISPLSLMLVDDAANLSNEDVEAIDKVLSVDDLRKYSSFYDVPCIWRSENCIRNFDNEEYVSFRNSFISVILKNKKLFFYSKLRVFLASTTFVEPDHFTTFGIFDDDKGILDDTLRPLFDNRIRKNIYRLIEGKTGNEFVDLFYRLVNNILLPLSVILISFAYFIYKKKAILAIICGTFMFGGVVVFFTAPAAYFMYYYFVFLWGWYLLVLGVIKLLSSSRRKKLRMV